MNRSDELGWDDEAAAGLFLPWPGSMALIRITEDTAHLAAAGHIGDPGIICACAPCLASRQETARERGRAAAEQEIISQARRSADARAQVTRELADYGASPYPASRGIEGQHDQDEPHPCTCRRPAWKPGSPYWAAHDVACPMRAWLCAEAGRKALPAAGQRDQDEPGRACCFSPEGCQGHQAPAPQGWVPTMAWAATVACSCGQAPDSMNWRDHVFGGCMRRMAISEVMRHEAEQWWEVTRSAILPDYGQFVAKIPDQPPGTCRECRTGPLHAGQLCWYCNLLGEREAFLPGLKPKPAPAPVTLVDQAARDASKAARQKRIARRRAARQAVAPQVRAALRLGLAGFICVVLASHVPSLGFLIVPGIILLAAAFITGRRR